MKSLVTTAVAIAILAVLSTAVFAADFTCNVTKVGNQFTYTLRNNHPTWDVVEWRLCWNNDDALNAPIAAANFTRANESYISLPSSWFRSDDATEPRAWTDDPGLGNPVLHNSGVGGQKSFTIVYKATNSTPAPMFKVATTNSALGNSFNGWTSAINCVPEPSSIAALLSGMIGSGLFLRRKRS